MTDAPAPQTLVIATRASRLALWQARHVQARLHRRIFLQGQG